jgi:hypothetical protein
MRNQIKTIIVREGEISEEETTRSEKQVNLNKTPSGRIELPFLY